MAKKHPNKEIQEVIEYPIKNGWEIKESSGHAWGKMYCPYNDSNCRLGNYCIISIWSTPKKSYSHAQQIKRVVDKCIYMENK